MKNLLWILLLFVSSSGFTNNYIDSLELVLRSTKADSVKIETANTLAWEYKFNNHLRADSLLQLALQLSNYQFDQTQDTIYLAMQAKSYNIWGVVYDLSGDPPSAIASYQNVLRIGNMLYQSNNTKWKSKAAYVFCSAHANMGVIYMRQGEMEKSIEMQRTAIKYAKVLNDTNKISNSYNNIGLVYYYLNNPDSATYYYNQSIQFDSLLGNYVGVALSLNTVGAMHYEIEDYQEALRLQQIAYNIQKEYNDEFGLQYTTLILGGIYRELNDYNKALKWMLESKSISEALNGKNELVDTYMELSDVYEKMGNYAASLQYYKLHTATKDSIFSESKSKDIGRLEAKYEMEKKMEEEQRAKEEAERQMAQKVKRRNSLQYSIIFIVILILGAAVLALGKISVSPSVAEGLIFFTFLLFFEFLLVLLDPYIETISGGEPMYKLFANAVLAGAIFPLHAFFENHLKQRLVKS